MAPLTLSDIGVYPVKSMRGIYPQEVDATPKGLNYDRQWMVVSPDGSMHSQRTLPAMATIGTELTTAECILRIPNQPPLHLPLDGFTNGEEKSVHLWGQTLRATHLDRKIDSILSNFFETAVELVFLPPSSKRPLDPDYAVGSTIGFSDGFPFLVTTQASLDELNSKLTNPVSMKRFRPNLVIAGSQPFDEDRWKKIQIGPAIFSLVKPCTRCSIVATNPQSGKRSPEVLQLLNRLRVIKTSKINGVIFGENAISDFNGKLKIGMPVKVLEENQ